MSNNNAHLLFINPWIHDFAAYDYWLKPLGLLNIASIFREEGFNISFVDCLNRHDTQGNNKIRANKQFGHGRFFKEEIQKPKQLANIPRRFSRYGIQPDLLINRLNSLPSPPDAILMTTLMTYWYTGTIETINVVRKHFPAVPIILGGNYVKLCTEHSRTLDVDYCIETDGIADLMRMIGHITKTSSTHRTTDYETMDALPLPAFDMIEDIDYICIQTSKGCPFKCRYCASSILNNTFKRQSPDRVLKEIEFWYKKYSIRNFTFYDDALLFEPDRYIIPILRQIIDSGIKDIFFHTPNGLHVRFIDFKLAKLLHQTGFKTLRLGYESADIETQRSTGGKVNDQEIKAAISYLKQAGFRQADIGVYLMIGLPGQGLQEIEKGIKKVIELGGTPILTEYSPIPGTAMWEEAVLQSKYDLAHDPIYHNNSILPCEWEGFSWSDFLKIKSKVGELRRHIKAGIN